MEKYEVEITEDEVTFVRVLEKNGDTFVVNNKFIDHIGTVIKGEVVVTRADRTQFTLRAGDSTPVNIGDQWSCVAASDSTITECSLPAKDARTWQELGHTQENMEKYLQDGRIQPKGTTPRTISSTQVTAKDNNGT